MGLVGDGPLDVWQAVQSRSTALMDGVDFGASTAANVEGLKRPVKGDVEMASVGLIAHRHGQRCILGTGVAVTGFCIVLDT